MKLEIQRTADQLLPPSTRAKVVRFGSPTNMVASKYTARVPNFAAIPHNGLTVIRKHNSLSNMDLNSFFRRLDLCVITRG